MRSLWLACTTLATTALAADAGAPLNATWATPFRETMAKRAPCAVPDGGVRVSAFDALPPDWAEGDAFPQPHHVVFSDAEGRFEIALEEHGLALLECADGVFAHAPSGFDASWRLPAHRLLRSLESAPPEGLFAPGVRVRVVNPWTRQRAVVSADAWSTLPDALTAGGPWLTTLDGPRRTRRAGQGWSDFALREPLPTDAGLAAALAFSLRDASTPPFAGDAGVVALRVSAPEGLPPRPLTLTVSTATGEPWSVRTRANGADLALAAGRYTVRAAMPGALDAVGEFELTSGAVQVDLALKALPGGVVRVVDAAGAAVAGATVLVDGAPAGETDAAGDFAITTGALPRTLSASHPGGGSSPTVTAFASAPVTLKLTPKSAVSLRVTTPDGTPAWGEARVFRAAPRDGWWGNPEAKLALRASSVSLAGLARGRYVVLLVTPEWRAEPVAVTVGSQRVEQPVRLSPRPRVRGTALRDGRPVEGARVKFLRPSSFDVEELPTVTGADGSFELTRALPGDAVLVVGGQRAPVKVPGDDVRVQLR